MSGSDLLQSIATADNVTATVAASYVLWQAGRGLWKRTLGSKRIAAKALHSLTPGNPVGRVEELFGQHLYSDPLDEVSGGSGERRLYNARHGWLTVHYENAKLIAFAFMLTDKSFRFDLGPICRGVVEGRLGRASYLDLNPETPTQFIAFMGAYNWGYSERHYYGRPGNYQWYDFSTTMYGWADRRDDAGLLASIESGLDPESQNNLRSLTGAQELTLRLYRSATAPDTIALIGPLSSQEDYPLGSLSYDQDDLRNLEGQGPRGWQSRSTFEKRSRRLHRRLLRALFQ